jgi:hypothetical protein
MKQQADASSGLTVLVATVAFTLLSFFLLGMTFRWILRFGFGGAFSRRDYKKKSRSSQTVLTGSGMQMGGLKEV